MSSEAFDAFVAARYSSLLRAGFVLTGDRGHAEDLVQAALMRSYPAWKGSAPASPEAYVRAVMVRLALRWRRRRSFGETPTATVPEASAGDAIGALDLSLALQAALKELTVEHRAVIVLRYLGQLSEAETAAVLGCSVGTVKSRHSRALGVLRRGGVLEEREHA